MTQQLQTETAEYSQAERTLLLRLAHQAIRAALEGRSLKISPPSNHLAKERGAFTTLHLDGHLRGCIGHIFAASPLYETVMETAVAAAFEDPRFVPVSLGEAEDLSVEISVLSPIKPIQPEEVIVGRHGLMITLLDRRGLLLPQVPVEWGWDREKFLGELCRKAGLPRDAWLDSCAKLEAFTAEVFGEESPCESLRDEMPGK